MRCSGCGEDNRDDARFCASCGVRIAARCTTCERELSPGARFCDGCGAPVVEAAGAPESAEQSRKTLTIVFADLQGSTGLQEGMDPESVRALMGRYYAAMREAVEAHGGKVVKFVGDGAMAVFGVPEVAEDDAVRAVRAAVAMQAAFGPLADSVRDRLDVELALRVGVNTGEVVVDADDTDVVGDAVNVAARLEGAAGAGDVLVGEETWRLTRHAARFDEPVALMLKGRAEPVAAHRLVGLDDEADTAASPFVGRRNELQTLRAAFDETVAAGQPRLATIIGSPGVGKSRLVQQLRAELGDRALTVRGRCDQHGGAAFAPVAELLDGFGPLSDLLDGDPERDRLLTATDSLAGAGSQATPEETFWAVRRVLETAARRAPVVAVLDDLHWAGPLLLDLVEHLAEWLNQPVLLVAVARPELRELRPSLTEGHGRPGARIALEGLERDATERLACELLGTDRVPVELLDRLVASSDGNPLFVRELVRMLIEDGVVRRDEHNEWTLAVDAADMEVPPTIQSLLAARLDRLRPHERTVLERAAVIGAEVYRGALDHLVPPEVRADLDTLLEALRRKELLEPAGTYWIDERVLRFHHALIREAAYRRLLKESRAGLHERMAAWLVAKTGGDADHDETIGFHLEQAQANMRSLGPLDEHGRELAADAATRLGAAARRALDRDDLLAAASLAGRAVACLDADDRARADILLTRCEALLGAGDVAAAGPAIEELSRLGAGSRRIEAWATCFAVQHTALVEPRSLGDAETSLVDAAAILDGAGDAAGAAKAHRVHAALLARLGRVGDCEAALDRALGAARAAADRRQMTSVLGAAPLAALWGPSPVPRAGGRCLDVIRLVRITTGAPAVEATSIRCQAVLEAFRGRSDAARSLIASARAIAEELGLRHGLLEVELFAGIVELCVGDAAAAADHLRRAQDGFTAMGVTADAAQAAALRGRAALALGQVDAALDYVATSEALGGQDLKTSIAWRAVEAEVLAARGNVAEALELAQAAVALAEPTDALVDRADAMAALAAVHAAAGDAAAAAEAWARARQLYEQKGATAPAAGLGASPDAATTSPPPEPASEVSTVGNSASRAIEEFLRMIVAGRVSDAAAVCAQDIVMEDHRPGMSARLVGLTEFTEQINVLADIRVPTIDVRPLAVRGDGLVVCEAVYGGHFEVAVVNVIRTDSAGLIDRFYGYEPGDLNVAMQELDELYVAGLSEGRARCVRSCLATVHAQNARDWTTLRSLLAEDLRVVDHRPASWGEVVGPDALLEHGLAIVDVSSDYTLVVRSVLAVDERCALAETVSIVRQAAGMTYEQPRLILGTPTADGRVASFEFFAPEQLNDAWARYRELTASATAIVAHNAASAAFERMLGLLLEGRPEETAALLAPDMHYEDVRPAMETSLDGRAANVEHFRVLTDLGGIEAIDLDVVAVRGERLALVQTLWLGGTFEIEIMTIVRLDADGLMDLHLDSDRGDLAVALEALDELYAAELPEGEARCHRANAAFLAAQNRSDWTAVRETVSEDFRIVDHAVAAAGEVVGVDACVEYVQAMLALAPDYRVVGRRLLGINEDSLIAETVSLATGAAESAYEQPRVVVTVLDADGRVARLEFFAPEQLDEAWARYRELSAAGGEADELDNHVVRVAQRAVQAAFDGRIDELPISPDVVFEDRRPGLAARVEGGIDFLDMARFILDTGVPRVEVVPVAVRGDELAVVRMEWGSEGDLEVSTVNLVRAPGGGPIDLVIGYDPADIVGAFVELDEQYAAGEATAYADLVRLQARLVRAHAERDWDTWRAIHAENIVVEDHRPAGWGHLEGVEAMIERNKVMLELAPDYAMWIRRILALDERHGLAELNSARTTAGGEHYEIPRLALASLRTPAGPIERVQFFAIDQLDLALESFRALTSSESAGPPMANAASRALEEAIGGIGAQRSDEVMHLISPRVVREDRRTNLASRLEGPEAVRDMFEVLGGLGFVGVETEVLGIRGERLALVASRWQGDFEVEVVSLVRLDDAGVIDLVVHFDMDDLHRAFVELDELHAVGDENRALAGSRLWFAALIGGDRDSVVEMLTPDFVLDDRRAMFTNRVEGRAGMLEWFNAVSASGLTVDIDPIATRGERLALVRLLFRANDFELPSLALLETDEKGRGRWCATFDVDDLELALAELEAAWARYRELGGHT